MTTIPATSWSAKVYPPEPWTRSAYLNEVIQTDASFAACLVTTVASTSARSDGFQPA